MNSHLGSWNMLGSNISTYPYCEYVSNSFRLVLWRQYSIDVFPETLVLFPHWHHVLHFSTPSLSATNMASQQNQLVNPGNGNTLPHILLPLSQLLCLSLPPFRLRSAVFVPWILYLAYGTYTNHMGDTVASRALSGMHWTVFLGTLCKLVWARPEHDFWRLDRIQGEGITMSAFSPRKLRWAASLVFNLRGIGWNWQVKGVPAHRAPQQKAQFLVYQFGDWVKYYIITDLLGLYFETYHHAEGPALASLNLWDQHSLARSAANALFAGAKLYYPIQMNYTLASMISVLLGVCEPKDWPPLFGSIALATTLRNFWGKYWHQFIRKVSKL